MIRALGVGLLVTQLLLAGAGAATIYIGDAAASGKTVANGVSSYTSNALTLAFVKTGQTYVNTSGATQTIQLTEVNFFQADNTNAAARLTPFVAIYTGGQELGGSTAVGSNYTVLMIGDQIGGLTGSAVLRNLGFLTGGVNPTITLNAGATLVAGYVTAGGSTGDLVRNSPTPLSGVNDYLASGSTLPGALGSALTGNSSFTGTNFDRNQQFNIGFVIVPEPSKMLLFGLGIAWLGLRRVRIAAVVG